jgi:hypothetical protein
MPSVKVTDFVQRRGHACEKHIERLTGRASFFAQAKDLPHAGGSVQVAEVQPCDQPCKGAQDLPRALPPLGIARSDGSMPMATIESSEPGPDAAHTRETSHLMAC